MRGPRGSLEHGPIGGGPHPGPAGAAVRAMRGEFEQARALYAGARAKLEDLRAGFAAARTSIGSARVEMLAGNLPAAEVELRRDHDALTAMGERNFLFTVAGQLARVVLAQGHVDEAERLASMVRAEAPAGDADAQVLWRSVMARVLADRADFGRGDRYGRGGRHATPRERRTDRPRGSVVGPRRCPGHWQDGSRRRPRRSRKPCSCQSGRATSSPQDACKRVTPRLWRRDAEPGRSIRPGRALEVADLAVLVQPDGHFGVTAGEVARTEAGDLRPSLGALVSIVSPAIGLPLESKRG